MDPCIQLQAGTSPIRSQGGEKPWRVKKWFFFLLLLGGLGQGAGQDHPGDPEHEHTCSHIRNIDMVTDSVLHMERPSFQCVPNEVMMKTTEKEDIVVVKQQEKNSSEKTDQHVCQDLTRTKREVDPQTCECPADRCKIDDCYDASPNFHAKGKQGWAAHATESVEFAELSPKLMTTSELQKKMMEESYASDSYQKEVTLSENNFFHLSFSEIQRVVKLQRLGKSVCKVIAKDFREGTGFVLFDHLILTNSHLFKGHVDEETLQMDVDVSVIFNYDDTEPDTNLSVFTSKKTLIDFDAAEDYAILELNPEGYSPNKKTTEKVPPGLLKDFGPVPQDGKAYIIGHSAGGGKKMDPTYIMKIEERLHAINDHLRLYKDHLFTVHSIIQVITKQGIEHILAGGGLAESVVSYKTSMLRGSSGSPVFDALGRVFGLHSLLFTHNFGDRPYNIMGCAYPLHIVFKHFVTKLKESGNYKLLSRVEEEVKGNKFLEMIIPPIPYSEYYSIRQFSADYTSKVCEKSGGKGNEELLERVEENAIK